MKTAKELRAEAASERKCRELAARDGAQHAKKFWAPLNQLCDAWEKNVASVRRKWWDDGACDDRRSIDRLFSKLSLGVAAFVKVAAATGFSKRIEQATEKDLPNKRHDANALRALQAAFEGSISARAVLEQIPPDDVERQTLFFKQGPPDFLLTNLKEVLSPPRPGRKRDPIVQKRECFVAQQRANGAKPAAIRKAWNEQNPKDFVSLDSIKGDLKKVKRRQP